MKGKGCSGNGACFRARATSGRRRPTRPPFFGAIRPCGRCRFAPRSWRQSARLTLTSIDWLTARQINLHSLLKKGQPSSRLVVKLAMANPKLLNERDDEGLQDSAQVVNGDHSELDPTAAANALMKQLVAVLVPVMAPMFVPVPFFAMGETVIVGNCAFDCFLPIRLRSPNVTISQHVC